MKLPTILITLLLLTGCASNQYLAKQQLLLDVPEELLAEPAKLELINVSN